MAVSDNVIHSGVAPDTTLSADITAASTTISLASGTGWPSPSGGQKSYANIDPGGTEEIITYTSRSGGTLTGVTRGVNGTSAASHVSGTTVRHQWTAQEADDVTKATLNTLGRVTAANQILVSDSTTTLAALDVAASRLVGRAAAGSIDDLTVAQVKTLLALATADLSDFATAVDERARDALGTALVAGANITITPSDVGDTITIASSAAASAFVGAFLKKSATQTITTGNVAAIAFGAEDKDTNAFHDNTTNNERFTIPSGADGSYRFDANIEWTNGATTTGTVTIEVWKNGVAQAIAQQVLGADELTNSSRSTRAFSFLLDLVATDYIDLRLTNSSGSSVILDTGASCSLQGQLVGT